MCTIVERQTQGFIFGLCFVAAFPEADDDLLENIFTAIDQKKRGQINIKQLICALSTIFRGEKEDMIDFWFKMYDGDHDGCLEKREFAQMLQDVNNAGAAQSWLGFNSGLYWFIVFLDLI